MAHILVIHGPNLNLLGTREPEIYGSVTLDELNASVTRWAGEHDTEVDSFQSNVEGEIVDRIQQAASTYDGLLINAAGYTHTSVAIRDAIAAVGLPTVEVHLSNTQAREDFRSQSLLAGVVRGRVEGFGPDSYRLGLLGLINLLSDEKG